MNFLLWDAVVVIVEATAIILNTGFSAWSGDGRSHLRGSPCCAAVKPRGRAAGAGTVTSGQCLAARDPSSHGAKRNTDDTAMDKEEEEAQRRELGVC